EAPKQNTTKAKATSSKVRVWKSASAPAAAGAAKTNTFFTHCLGRSALIMPSTRFFGGWRLRESSIPWVCGSGWKNFCWPSPSKVSGLSVMQFSFHNDKSPQRLQRPKLLRKQYQSDNAHRAPCAKAS